MRAQSITSLLLVAIALQGVFGSLRDSVVIHLGGSHTHEHHHHHHHDHGCHDHHGEHGHHHCDHHDDQLATDDHHGCCQGTDLEVDLVMLLALPRGTEVELDLQAIPVPSFHATISQPTSPCALLRGPPPKLMDDPGGRHRMAVVRSTRLLV
ncbi:MAG: hypothetical protein MK116_05660 [Phycisphaerales bacterium]|nr:hypothetical protein [Phycisphaerales bacterium]